MLIDVGIEVGSKVKFIKKEESATDTDVPLRSVGIVTQVFELSPNYPKHYDVVFNIDGKTDYDIFYEGELELVGGEDLEVVND